MFLESLFGQDVLSKLWRKVSGIVDALSGGIEWQ